MGGWTDIVGPERDAGFSAPAGAASGPRPRRRRLGWLAAAVAALAVLAASWPAHSIEVIEATDAPLALEANRGLLVRLPGPAATVFVANPEIADIQVKSPRLVYIFGKKPGDTTLYAADQNERVLATQQIQVSHNIGRLRTVLSDLAPRSDFGVHSVGDALMLTGVVRSAADAENARAVTARFAGADDKVINRLQVTAPNQVHLRVRVAEVSRDVIKQIGINWESIFTGGQFLFGLATGNPVLAATAIAPSANPTGVVPFGPVDRTIDTKNLPQFSRGFLTRNLGPAQTTTNSLFGSFSSGAVDLNALIDALEDEGFISVLAEPNLTALSGETASFLAGGEFPIPVPQDANTITIEFKKFGVGLAFTPTISGPGRINLQVRPEVSELSNNGAIQFAGFTIPALTTRRAETTVELASGQSFAIAGLLQNNVTHDISKFPGLGDLPIIGALFRSDTFQRDESELVIIVTPYMVEPVSEARLMVPTDGYAVPTDSEHYFDGEHYRPAPAGPSVPHGAGGARIAPRPGLEGPVGFQVN